jgi:hypothetical protein
MEYRGAVGYAAQPRSYLDYVRLSEDMTCADEQPPTEGQIDCPTVTNANMADSTGWQLSGTAAITNGLATLPHGSAIIQNLSLSANVSYNTVISVTDVTDGPAWLTITLLGAGSQDDIIDQGGLYTYTLTTQANLSGPIGFSVLNNALELDSPTVIIDYICLYPAAAGPGGEQVTCLAPTNGTFDTSVGWDFYRGATWDQPAGYVTLPDTTNGLVWSTGVYSLPAISADQHLLLKFNSMSTSQGGGVSVRVGNQVNEAIGNFSNYPTWYTFEIDLGALAGTTDNHVSAANPGSSLEGASSSTGRVDNVCIFVSDRSALLPYPVDPNGITPINLGFGNITSCSDVDGIWAGLGVNMAQYRANYASGFSFWDPTEWLVSAIFVMLADWSCMFIASFLSLLRAIEYLINNFLNIGNWLIRLWPAFIAWLWLWLNWIGQSLTNLSNSYGAFLAAWAEWIGATLGLASGIIGATLAAASEWIGQSLTNLSNSYGAFLAAWAEWIGTSLANLSAWIGDTLATLWGWLSQYLFELNGLKTIVNWLIAAWNFFIKNVGVLISDIIGWLAGLWNDVLFPFFQAVFDYFALSLFLSQLLGTILDLLGISGSFFIAIIKWSLENVIQFFSSPIDLYYGFFDGLNADGFQGFFACTDNNLWCYIFSGVQVINEVLGPSVMYPLVIVGIILVTILVFGRKFEEIYNFVMTTLRDL